MEQVLNKNAYKKLGFNHMETAAIVVPFNKLLNNYQVFYHKMQAFHWNAVGGDFYDLHEIFEQLYNKSVEDIDVLAERIRIFGQKPNTHIDEYREEAEIEINKTEMSGEFMIKETISDIETLLSFMIEVNNNALTHSDFGSFHVVSGMIHRLEMQHWQLTAFINKKYENA